MGKEVKLTNAMPSDWRDAPWIRAARIAYWKRLGLLLDDSALEANRE